MGTPSTPTTVFGTMLHEALRGDADAGGLLAYNYLSGEPITGLVEGRPLVAAHPRQPADPRQLRAGPGLSAPSPRLSLGMRVLAEEGVELDVMVAHGGLFRTEGVAQRLWLRRCDPGRGRSRRR